MEYTVESLRELKNGVHEDHDFPIMDIEEVIREMDAEDEERLLLVARSYLKFTDEEFKERIDYFASIGEAIIREEEYEIAEEELRKEKRREEGRIRATLA